MAEPTKAQGYDMISTLTVENDQLTLTLRYTRFFWTDLGCVNTGVRGNNVSPVVHFLDSFGLHRLKIATLVADIFCRKVVNVHTKVVWQLPEMVLIFFIEPQCLKMDTYENKIAIFVTDLISMTVSLYAYKSCTYETTPNTKNVLISVLN